MRVYADYVKIVVVVDDSLKVKYGVRNFVAKLQNNRARPVGIDNLVVSKYAEPVQKTEVKLTIGSTTAYVNGQAQTLDVAPVIENSRTLMPLRFIAEAMGATVEWDGATSTATLTEGETKVVITLGSTTAYANGTAKTLDAPAESRNGRTLLPVRFIAENLGYEVDYDHEDHSAVIDSGRIVLYIGTDQAEINGEKVQLDTPSVLISDRTMVPLRIIAETLGCTVDWFNTNRTVLVNKRLADGSEMPVFDRFEQSGLFWAYSTQANDYLVWKANYKTLEEAADGENFDAWWIERPRDKQDLVNPFLDCTIMARTFEPETLAQIKDMFFTVYPTRYADAADLMMDSIRGELWQSFYEEDAELYPLYSVMPPRSGTFGSYYFDNREVEMYVNETCTRLMINVNAEGYENPDIPRTLTDEEIAFYTEQAKQSYMLDLWNLD